MELMLMLLQVVWSASVGDDDSRGAVQGCGYIGCDLGCRQQLTQSADPGFVSRWIQVTHETLLVSSASLAVSDLCT